MPTKRRRRTTAPPAPQIWPRIRSRLGRARTASAMTSALSPDRSRLRTQMPNSRAQNSGSVSMAMALRSPAARALPPARPAVAATRE